MKRLLLFLIAFFLLCTPVLAGSLGGGGWDTSRYADITSGTITGVVSPSFITNVTITGLTGTMSCLVLIADAAENNADSWRLCVADDGDATLESYTSGNWVAKWTTSNAGLFTVADDIVIKDGGTIGSASATTAITISSGGLVTASTLTSTGAFTSPGIDDNADANALTISSGEDVTLTQDLLFGSGKLLGTTGDPDLMTIADDTLTIAGAHLATTYTATAVALPITWLLDSDAAGSDVTDQYTAFHTGQLTTVTEDGTVANWGLGSMGADTPGTARLNVHWNGSAYIMTWGVMTNSIAAPAAVSGYEALQFDFDTAVDNQVELSPGVGSGVTDLLLTFDTVTIGGDLVVIGEIHRHAGMYFNANLTDTVITTVATDVGINYFTEGPQTVGFTYEAGEIGTINAVADNGGDITITAGATVNMSVGDAVVLDQTSGGTYDFTGVYLVTAVSGSTFDVTFANWDSTETGVWQSPSQYALTASGFTAHLFDINYHLSMRRIANSGAADVDIKLWINTTENIRCHARIGLTNEPANEGFENITAECFIELSTDDVFYLTVANEDTTDDLEFKYGTIRVEEH